ncbi:TPA: hypothetical protein EYP44_02825, partial [Candidatus Bathyarchaeota archaeon]|nr:hypothetical protein [Candidatus Bathyarchaeota archaeon]
CHLSWGLIIRRRALPVRGCGVCSLVCPNMAISVEGV